MHELTVKDIQAKIINLPNRPPFMLAQDVAMIYDSTSELVHQAVRRNPDRFPDDFAFRLTAEEVSRLQNEGANHSLSLANTRTEPLAFTRFGANQLSTVLKTAVAARRSVQIMRAFSMMEEGHFSGQPHPTDTQVDWLSDYVRLLRDERDRATGKTGKRKNFTAEDDAMVLELREQGLSHRQIGLRIGRVTGSVRSCLYRLGALQKFSQMRLPGLEVKS